MLFLWKYKVICVHFASKIKICVHTPVWCVLVAYNYTRIFKDRSDCYAYLFIQIVPPSLYICLNLRSHHDFGLKNPINVHKIKFFIEFVHTKGGFSGVFGGCIFTHPTTYLFAWKALHQLCGNHTVHSFAILPVIVMCRGS